MNKSAKTLAEELLPFMNKQMGGPYRKEWKNGFIAGHHSRDEEVKKLVEALRELIYRSGVVAGDAYDRAMEALKPYLNQKQ